MEIKFIDQNEGLVKKVTKAIKYLPFQGVSAHVGDIFKHKGIIVSASNPHFSMGGGLDALIAKKYPDEVKVVQKKNKPMQVDNVLFTITVGEDLVATRELIAEALRFAFDEKNHKAPNQTILVSGLGTGIGGLDEDDFVWLFLQAVCEAYGYGWGIKFVKKNKTDFYTGKILYKAGTWLEQLDAKKDCRDCGVGLHVGKSFIGAGNYCLPETIFFCLYEKKDLCGEGSDKIRVSRLLPLVQLPQWLGYGKNGKKIVSKIGKLINTEDYNPYQATKLPTIDAIKKSWAQVWDQVRDQVGATSYWAINLRFSLGLSHWFGDFLKLGVMIVYVQGKAKIFGKKGVYLGEYDQSDLV